MGSHPCRRRRHPCRRPASPAWVAALFMQAVASPVRGHYATAVGNVTRTSSGMTSPMQAVASPAVQALASPAQAAAWRHPCRLWRHPSCGQWRHPHRRWCGAACAWGGVSRTGSGAARLRGGGVSPPRWVLSRVVHPPVDSAGGPRWYKNFPRAFGPARAFSGEPFGRFAPFVLGLNL